MGFRFIVPEKYLYTLESKTIVCLDSDFQSTNMGPTDTLDVVQKVGEIRSHGGRLMMLSWLECFILSSVIYIVDKKNTQS